MLYNSNHRLFGRNEFANLFAELNKAYAGSSYQVSGKQLNFDETEKGLVATIDLPGVSPDQLEVQTQGNILSIEVAPDADKDDASNVLICEWATPKLEQRLRLPDKFDTNKIDASLTNGVFSITIPKAEEAKSRTVNVVAA